MDLIKAHYHHLLIVIDFVTDAATVVSLSIFSESRVTRAEDAFFVVVTSPSAVFVFQRTG